jgi:hypothetical protein
LTARQTLHLQQILEKVRRTTVMNPLFIVPLNEKPKTSEKQVTYASNDMHYMVIFKQIQNVTDGCFNVFYIQEKLAKRSHTKSN